MLSDVLHRCAKVESFLLKRERLNICDRNLSEIDILVCLMKYLCINIDLPM